MKISLKSCTRNLYKSINHTGLEPGPIDNIFFETKKGRSCVLQNEVILLGIFTFGVFNARYIISFIFFLLWMFVNISVNIRTCINSSFSKLLETIPFWFLAWRVAEVNRWRGENRQPDLKWCVISSGKDSVENEWLSQSRTLWIFL